jgi:hypothetical protein
LALASQAKAFPKGDLHPIAKVTPITERFQHFVEELQESFWGDLYGQTRAAWKKFFELDSERLRDRYAGWNRYRRGPRKAGGVWQRLLQAGFCHGIRNHPAADGARTGEELSAEGHRAVSAAGSGAGDAGARSVIRGSLSHGVDLQCAEHQLAKSFLSERKVFVRQSETGSVCDLKHDLKVEAVL